MNIWIYCSESNPWINFYIILKKTENFTDSNKVLLVLDRRTGAHREDWTKINCLCYYVYFSAPDNRFPVALGRKQTSVGYVGVQHVTCILCQEEQDVRHNSRAMVLAAYIQRYAYKNNDCFDFKREKNVCSFIVVFIYLHLFKQHQGPLWLWLMVVGFMTTYAISACYH